MPEILTIFDFEATCCDQGFLPREEMEIIEIGCVMVQASKVHRFTEALRPRPGHQPSRPHL